MGKPNPSFQKRLREQKKREKRQEKERRKEEREQSKKDGTFSDDAGDLTLGDEPYSTVSPERD